MNRLAESDIRAGHRAWRRAKRQTLSVQARNSSSLGDFRKEGKEVSFEMLLVIVNSRRGCFRAPEEATRTVPPRQNRADDVEEYEGGFCRRTHVTSDSFSTPASRRRAFIPTPHSTPPFASLDQHPAGPDWSARCNCRVGEHPVTRGFYGNGGGVARDNLVIGIAATAAGTSMGSSDAGCGVEGRRGRQESGGGRWISGWKRDEGEREINARRLVYRQQSRAKSRGAHPCEHCLFMRVSLFSGREEVVPLGLPRIRCRALSILFI